MSTSTQAGVGRTRINSVGTHPCTEEPVAERRRQLPERLDYLEAQIFRLEDHFRELAECLEPALRPDETNPGETQVTGPALVPVARIVQGLDERVEALGDSLVSMINRLEI